MSRNVLLSGLFVILLTAVPASGFHLYGLLDAGDYEVSGDSILWSLRGSSFPVWERTPGWAADSGGKDTFLFERPEDWPLRLILYYTLNSDTSLQFAFDTLLGDIWYPLPVPEPGARAPWVKFVDTLTSAVRTRDDRPLAVLVAGPNPFLNRTLFGVPAPGPARIEIFDRTGRPVHSLSAPAGTRHVSWDGRDHDDNRLPAGVYLARLEGAEPRVFTRLVLLD